jgi:hypothetical protein
MEEKGEKEGRVIRRLLEGQVMEALEEGDINRFEREVRGVFDMYSEWEAMGLGRSS